VVSPRGLEAAKVSPSSDLASAEGQSKPGLGGDSASAGELGSNEVTLGMQDPTVESSPSSPRFDANNSDEIFLLGKVYRRVDRRRVGRVSAEDLAGELDSISRKKHASHIPQIRKAIRAVNEELAIDKDRTIYSTSSGNVARAGISEYPDELSFEGFKYLILAEDIERIVPPDIADIVHDIREMYVKWTTDMMIQERTQVARDELHLEEETSPIPSWLEPAIGALILLNAVCIGMSLDVLRGSLLWTVVEVFFSTMFLLELLIKVCCVGCREHFFGLGWVWNWFDLCIVAIALLDVCFLVLNQLEVYGLPDLNAVTIVRLIRLVRMARLVRLMRMKLFKELTLMIYGVIGGLRTLCWAFVLLGVLVFILGVYMRQLIEYTNLSCLDMLALGSDCSTSEELLATHTEALFSSVMRSMFTVFRCLIGDCSAPDGVPLAPHLMNVLGFTWTMGYVLTTCFVLFGVFNLVMAIFVENTLETARQSQQKRQAARTKEHVRVAQELREIVLRICTRDRKGAKASKSKSSFFKRSLFKGKDEPSPDSGPEEEETLQMAVSRPVFEEVMQDPKVIAILEDLEIGVTSSSKLFDIIDSNGSGLLDVGELIEGLMKLRGPADKGDVVCASLMVRSVQRELQRLDVEMLERHRVLQVTQAQILARLNHQDVMDDGAGRGEVAGQAGQQHSKWKWW